MFESKDEIGKTIFGIDFSMATDTYVIMMVAAAVIGFGGGRLYRKYKNRNKK
jgi:hypothetical protein